MLKTIELCLALSVLAACNKDEKEKTSVAAATAKLKMENVSTSALNLVTTDPTYDNPAKYTPSVFKMKILKIAIAQEKDTTKYPASVLYIDPAACAPQEIETSAEQYSPDVAAEDRIFYKYIGTLDLCLADKTTTMIDLAQSSAVVNAALNAQSLPVLPGSYKHVMLDLCFQNSDKGANILFKADGMDAEQPLIKPGSCAWTSAEMNPPLVIAKDSSAVVNLNYNINDLVLDYGPDTTYTPYLTGENVNCYESADKTIHRCLDSKLINITATVTAQ